jgi:hypothetical protein
MTCFSYLAVGRELNCMYDVVIPYIGAIICYGFALVKQIFVVDLLCSITVLDTVETPKMKDFHSPLPVICAPEKVYHDL